jgi:hypothetical protein
MKDRIDIVLLLATALIFISKRDGSDQRCQPRLAYVIAISIGEKKQSDIHLDTAMASHITRFGGAIH